MRYKAALFDLDGTLLDTLDDLADSMNAVLGKNRFPTHPRAYYKKCIGGGIDNLVQRVLPDVHGDKEKIEVISAEMREEYSRRWKKKTRLYPGIDSMLDGLRKQGLSMSILSNKPDNFTQIICRHFLSSWDFKTILGASEAFPRKPDPGAALFIAGEMGIDPAECLYLGDSDIDMKTAVAAGMYPVGALWGFREAGELLSHGARLLLKEPEELLAFLSLPQR